MVRYSKTHCSFNSQEKMAQQQTELIGFPHRELRILMKKAVNNTNASIVLFISGMF